MKFKTYWQQSKNMEPQFKNLVPSSLFFLNLSFGVGSIPRVIEFKTFLRPVSKMAIYKTFFSILKIILLRLLKTFKTRVDTLYV